MSGAAMLDRFVADAVACESNGHPLTVNVSRYTLLQPCPVLMCPCGEMGAARVRGEIYLANGRADVKAMFANRP